MPVFNSYTRPTALGDTFKPIDDNIQLLGAQTMYNRAEQNAQKIGGQFSNLFGVTTYGKDAEVLSQIEDEARKQIQEISKGNLENPETVSRVNSLISQYKNHPDVQAVTQRASAFENEAKRKQEAEAKGQTYVSPLLREAEKYYSSGEYLTDKRFNRSGFVAPDNKELDEIAKNTPEWQNIVTTGGYDITQKGKAEGALASNYYAHFTTDPKWNSLLNDQFQQNLDGVDIQDIHNQGLEGVKQLFPHLPLEAQQRALADIEEGYQLQQNNPYIGDAWKNKLKEDYFQNQAYMAAQAKTYVNTTDKKQNAYAKDALDFRQAKELASFKEQEKNKYKQAAAKSTDPLKRQMIMQAINLGYTTELEDPTQPDGLISTVELAKLGIAKPTETKEEKAAEKEVAKEDIASFRNIFNVNKNKAEKIIKEKAGDLGWNFDADDIEEVKWNKDSNRYEVKVDDLYTTEVISFTQDEMDKLNKIAVKKGNEIIEIPISDTEALDEAEKEGYTKQ